MANQYVCAYFKSDKSFSVIPKNRCALRGGCQVGEEVEVSCEDQKATSKPTLAQLSKQLTKVSLSTVISHILTLYERTVTTSWIVLISDKLSLCKCQIVLCMHVCFGSN